MRGICEVCHIQTDVIPTIYGETGEKVLRCWEHLNTARDFKAKPKIEVE